MGQYGKVALEAYALANSGINQLDAWRQAALALTSKSSREKMCPKATFIGLCDAGLLTGVPKQPDNLNQNAKYGRIAVFMLREDSAWAASKKSEMWRAVMQLAGEPEAKKQNGQLDVVLSLWNAGHIEKAPQ